jgi:hypothetical protein
MTNTSRNCRLVSVYLPLSVNRQYTSKTTLVDFHHPHSDIDVDFIIKSIALYISLQVMFRTDPNTVQISIGNP